MSAIKSLMIWTSIILAIITAFGGEETQKIPESITKILSSFDIDTKGAKDAINDFSRSILELKTTINDSMNVTKK